MAVAQFVGDGLEEWWCDTCTAVYHSPFDATVRAHREYCNGNLCNSDPALPVKQWVPKPELDTLKIDWFCPRCNLVVSHFGTIKPDTLAVDPWQGPWTLKMATVAHRTFGCREPLREYDGTH